MPSTIFQATTSTARNDGSTSNDVTWTNAGQGVVEDSAPAQVTLNNATGGGNGQSSFFLDLAGLGIEEGVTLPSGIIVTALDVYVRCRLVSNSSANPIHLVLSVGQFSADPVGSNNITLTNTAFEYKAFAWLPLISLDNAFLNIMTLVNKIRFEAAGTGIAVVEIDHAYVEIFYDLIDSEFWTEFQGTTEILGG